MDSQKLDTQKLEPNLRAQTKRHSRVFLKTIFFSKMIFRLLLDVKVFFKRRKSDLKLGLDKPIEVRDPRNTLFRQVMAAASALFVITSFAPTSILDTGFSADYFDDTDFVEEGDELVPPFMMNEEGFVLKTSPASQDSNRTGLTDFAEHTVVPGDTCSGVASLYGISVDTLAWENGLSDECRLKVGQTLVVPPVDGVSCEVSNNGQTLGAIAKKCSGDVEKIKAFNHIEGDKIAKGQRLFVPGGKRPQEARVIARFGVRASGRAWNGNTFDRKVVFSSNEEPVDGDIFIKPANCKVTQGFRRGHYATDCSNTSRPDIVATAPGTIILAKGGCPNRDVKVEYGCNGGYGNYIIEQIDDSLTGGKSIQVLSAHCETLYVSEGQRVERGQAICKMGSSGKVHGSTGIHLHTEIFIDGVKKNPLNYLF